jgi:hypothetical protein
MANRENCVPDTRSSATRTTVAVVMSVLPPDPRDRHDDAERSRRTL